MKKFEGILLDTAIAQSSFLDWDENLIDSICAEHNLTAEAFGMIFPQGLESLADVFFKRIDEAMVSIIADGLHELPIHMQVSKFLAKRLSYMNGWKSVSIKILAMPARLSYRIAHPLHVADLIWHNVRHESHGFDYYTRRMILSCVYARCLIKFKDNLPIEEMIEYMHKQLKLVGKISKLKKTFPVKFRI